MTSWLSSMHESRPLFGTMATSCYLRYQHTVGRLSSSDENNNVMCTRHHLRVGKKLTRVTVASRRVTSLGKAHGRFEQLFRALGGIFTHSGEWRDRKLEVWLRPAGNMLSAAINKHKRSAH